MTTARYVSEKASGRQDALAAISDLLRLFDVVPVERTDFFQAMTLRLRDFEDAVQVVCAMKIGADFIVTRNEKDFEGSPIPVRTAGQVLSLL